MRRKEEEEKELLSSASHSVAQVEHELRFVRRTKDEEIVLSLHKTSRDFQSKD